MLICLSVYWPVIPFSHFSKTQITRNPHVKSMKFEGFYHLVCILQFFPTKYAYISRKKSASGRVFYDAFQLRSIRRMLPVNGANVYKIFYWEKLIKLEPNFGTMDYLIE